MLTLWPSLRAGERAAVIFFAYLSALAWVQHLGIAPGMFLLALPVVVCALAAAESAHSTPLSRVVRDWLSMGLILAAYWSVGWFVAPEFVAWRELWVGWDRLLLDEWGLRAAVESAGVFLPSVLEIVYLLLYSIPPICVCVLYSLGGRERVHEFLFMLLLGTCSAYALLPLLPVHGPHVVYPALDLPQISGFSRNINFWVLDHMDIPTSVFPSGHVAVAFSAAFGMFRAVRGKPLVWGSVFAVAFTVYVATVYCRYHYAVDGLASVFVVGLAHLVSRRGGAID